MKNLLLAFIVVLSTGFAQVASGADTPDTVPRMTVEQLNAQLDKPNLVIIDVRSTQAWKDSETKIKGAVREDPSKTDTWIDKYPKDKTIVTY